MTTELKKTEIANQFLNGLRTRDWGLLKSMMADDVVWNLPGSSLISGEAQGVDAVIQRAQLIVRWTDLHAQAGSDRPTWCRAFLE